MSDVLIQNAFTENRILTRCYLTNIRSGTSCSLSCFAAGNSSNYSGFCRTGGAASGGANTVIDTYWCLLPVLQNPTTGFKVCETAGYYRCGASCSWTVPTGVCCAQFQLWGPGGGTGTNCCCGGAPFGPTGAYATVVMNVTPGTTYTICAGCAYCCYATQTTPGLIGSPSYVTGTGLSNFCADSGISCVCYWREAVTSISTGCMFPTGDTCGPESCSGWNFCWDSTEDSGYVPYAYSGYTKFYGTSTTGTVYGLNGLYPALCVGTNLNQTFSTAAPVYGFQSLGVCTHSFSAACAGCIFSFVYGSGRHPYPGQGGYASSVFGGCNACGGDSGRMGMVCVRYCCI